MKQPSRVRATAGVRAIVVAALACLLLAASLSAPASTQPQQEIEQTVQDLLDQFTAQREQLVGDNRALFALVDRVASPLFDFSRIAKLVLAKHWRVASAAQRNTFGEEFKKLLIATYATLLFKYTGDETLVFTGAEIREDRGRQVARVSSEVTLSDGESIPVNYSLLLDQDGNWRIYNLTISGLNAVKHYREVYGSAIGKQGIDGVIDEMKRANAKNY